MALFEVLDPNGGPAPPGPWETRPAPAASFSLGGEAAAPVWRVNLPADPEVAASELRAAEASLARQEAAVAAAPARLRTLARGGGAVSFSTAPAAPEARLLTLMRAPTRAAVSFGLGDGGARDELVESEERFQAFVQQIQDAVTNFAVVETRLEQALIARTSVSWTGDMRSLLLARVPAEQERLHHRSLDLTMRSRAALLRTFATVMRGATIVVMFASSPVGAVRALPAAWRFVDDILREQRGAA